MEATGSRLVQAQEGAPGDSIAEPGRATALPDLARQAMTALERHFAAHALELAHLDPVVVPLGDAVQALVVADRPELRHLAPERRRDGLEQPGRAVLEALGVRKRPRDAVLHLEARGVTLALGAQAGDDHSEQASDRDHAHPHEMLAAAEVVGAEPEHERERQGEQGHAGRVARARAGRRDQRAGHQELHKHHRRADDEVDHGHYGHGPERREKHAETAGPIPRNQVRAQPGARILR